MRLQMIVCQVIQREAYYCAARSRNVVDIVLLPKGLHDEPERLRAEVQRRLDNETAPDGSRYDASLLGYGLCSNGVVGVTARIPVVVPRAHDCITLLLGSKEKYKEYFDTHHGIYWYSAGWIEHNRQPSRERYEQTRREYEEKYGAENVEYLMSLEQGWMKEYSWATYVDWGFPDSKEHRHYTKESAAFLGWNYDEVPGDPDLMQRLVDGPWDEESFLVLQPGRRVAADVNNPGIIKAEPAPRPA